MEHLVYSGDREEGKGSEERKRRRTRMTRKMRRARRRRRMGRKKGRRKEGTKEGDSRNSFISSLIMAYGCCSFLLSKEEPIKE